MPRVLAAVAVIRRLLGLRTVGGVVQLQAFEEDGLGGGLASDFVLNVLRLSPEE